MALETGTYISDLNAANPSGSDARSTADDHLRLLKSTIKATFPNVTGAVTPTHTLLNKVGVTAAPGDVSTDPASTAFVNQALTIASTNGAMSTRVVSTVSTTAIAGEHIVLTNGSASAVTLPPAPLAGSRVWVTAANGLTTNTVLRNGSTIDAAASDYTITTVAGTGKFRYIDGTRGWYVESERVNGLYALLTHNHVASHITDFTAAAAAVVASTAPAAHNQTASTITDFTTAVQAVPGFGVSGALPVTEVLGTTATASNADQHIFCLAGVTTTISLPPSPSNNRLIVVTGGGLSYDTISGNGKSIAVLGTTVTTLTLDIKFGMTAEFRYLSVVGLWICTGV